MQVVVKDGCRVSVTMHTGWWAAMHMFAQGTVSSQTVTCSLLYGARLLGFGIYAGIRLEGCIWRRGRGEDRPHLKVRNRRNLHSDTWMLDTACLSHVFRAQTKWILSVPLPWSTYTTLWFSILTCILITKFHGVFGSIVVLFSRIHRTRETRTFILANVV